jgi:glycosyltransferase involved in cell wall biosynthesis
LVVLEALSREAAIVTTRRGGIPEIAEESVAYVREDPSSLATALGRFLDDATYAQDHRERAAKRAEEVSWQNQYDKLLEVLSSGSRAVPPPR